jgi:hypothetical protein
MATVRIVAYVIIGSALILAGLAGMEWADLHEPTLANAFSGRQLYADAGTIRILAVLGLIAGLGLIAWPIIKAVRHK